MLVVSNSISKFNQTLHFAVDCLKCFSDFSFSGSVGE